MPSTVRFSSSSAMAVTRESFARRGNGYGCWMTVALRQSPRFDASSPVTRYWLANCVGFSLAGGGRGTVERIIADIEPNDPSELEVRTGRRKVELVPTDAVIAVVPQEQVLVVDRRCHFMPDRK